MAIIPIPANANNKYASLIMDADTGVILQQSNADKMLHPASLTKMMTLLMLFEALDSGRIKLNDSIYISRNAASMVPSKLNLPTGSSILVKDAIFALVTKSANDVAVAVAEKLGKTETRFATMMTKRAQSMGMTRTHFMNASGLHHPKQVTTARDMAKMARYLIKVQPRYYSFFSTKNFTYRGKTYKNHNHLMSEYDGMDGIKTGYIQASGFNLVASAKRGNKRLIGVVFGGKTSKSRNAHMKELLDAGFKKIESTKTAAAKPVSTMLPVRNPRRSIAMNAPPSMPEPSKITTNSELTQNLLAARHNDGSLPPEFSDQQETRLNRYKNISSQEIPQRAVTTNVRTSETASNIQMHGFKNALMSPQNPLNSRWAIQVGAFSDRNTTDIILERAYKKLPTTLQYATMQVMPLQQSDNKMIYRAWITGFSQKDAKSACAFYKECLVIDPRS